MFYEENIEIGDWHREHFKRLIQFLDRYKNNRQSFSDNEMEEEVLDMLSWYTLQYTPNQYIREFVQSIEQEDFKKILRYLFRKSEKFQRIDETLEASELIKFGLELEVADFKPTKFEVLHETGALTAIMQALDIPDETSSSILDNVDYRRKNVNNKWTITKEASGSLEVSTPILTNCLKDLNQIAAIAVLLKGMGAELNGGTGLHVNIGVDYLECNAKALGNLLRIWRECEELFFKVANPEGDVIRIEARGAAKPVANGLEKYLQEDGSIQLNSEVDKEDFLFHVQADSRLEKILSDSKILKFQCWSEEDPEKRRRAYHEYCQYLKEHPNEDDPTRWTSINFTHMEWNNAESPGRIEVRIFNDSLDKNVLLEDVFLVLRLFEVSLRNAKDPNFKKEEFQRLYRRDVNEETKLDNLLDLLFDKEKHKRIYKRRWESIKNERDYDFTKGDNPTFVRDT